MGSILASAVPAVLDKGLDIAQGAIGGGVQAIGSLFGGRARRREEKNAQSEFDATRQQKRSFQFQNNFSNLENTAEDLTINQDAARFQSQQADASLQSGLDAILQTGGGGGGAQAIANAALASKRGISDDIARQEQYNNRARVTQAGQNQIYEARGAEQQQRNQFGQINSNYADSSNRLGAAKAARQQATEALVSGIGGFLGGGGAGLFKGKGKAEVAPDQIPGTQEFTDAAASYGYTGQ